MASPKCKNTQSALISDLFDIFVRIAHNASFGECFDTDVNFQIFIPHFITVVNMVRLLIEVSCFALIRRPPRI